MRTLSIKQTICKSSFVSLFWKNSNFAQSSLVSTDKSTATICENSICENTILSVQILSYGKTCKIYYKTTKLTRLLNVTFSDYFVATIK